MGNTFNKNKCSMNLRQAQSRINIHRSKKLTGLAKKKDDICKHLESGNEMNAKIWTETLINEEGQVPVYDVVSTMCDQVNGRLTQIEKFGAPKDMNQTFATIIHASRKLDINELLEVRKQLAAVLSPEFVKESDTNYDLINPVVAKNIDFRKPEDGEVVLRMVALAKERNIDYKPTHESCTSAHAYCLRKGIPPPEGLGGPDGPVPQYAPQPAPIDFSAIDQPPSQNNPPPSNMPPAGGMPPPSNMPPGAGMPPAGGMPPGAGMPPPNMPPGGGMGGPGASPAYNPNAAMPQAQEFVVQQYNPGVPTIQQPAQEIPTPQEMGQQPGMGGGAQDDFQARLDALKKM